jgi:signal transduction histidine kinase
MLWSLRARLIVSFALVVALAVFLAGAGALFLLRDEQQASARERYGRHAEPVNADVAIRLALGEPLSELRVALREDAEQRDVRILLIDDDLQVVFDSADELVGQYIVSFAAPRPVIEAGGSRFKWANYGYEDTQLTLFAPPAAPSTETATFSTPQYQALIAIPRDELATAWLDLAPPLAIAGAIALGVSFAVSFFISRSISGPLARITQASVQMSRGNYDVHIPIRGQDEVGRLSEAFNAMAREVNRSQRTMKDLLANVSHELKTPLTSIQGFSQAMLEGATNSEDEFRDSARIINDEANRMRALVDDLLLLSQIESGQVEMQHAHVDVKALLQRMIERFQWTMRTAGIECGQSFDQLPLIHGDERRLEQVFSNLIDNAIRHTPQGERITISAVVTRTGEVQVSVHNTGSTIPEEDLPRVFERFFQVDRARVRKGGSSGLGLSIVAEIVEAHRGTVRAVSDPDRGTEFIVTLPSANVMDSRNGHAPTTPGGKRKRSASHREAPA